VSEGREGEVRKGEREGERERENLEKRVLVGMPP